MEPYGCLVGAFIELRPVQKVGLVWSLRGALWEPLWSQDQSHKGLGLELQRSLFGAFMEPSPVPQGSWHGASRVPPASSHMLGLVAGVSSPSQSRVAGMEEASEEPCGSVSGA